MKIKSLNILVFIVAVLACFSVVNAAETIIDFKAIKQGDALHITATGTSADLWKNSQLMIDFDGDAKTGYRIGEVAEHGFDFMVEGSAIYRFKGSDQTAWSWEKAGAAQRSVDGTAITIDIDLKTIGVDSLGSTSVVLLRGLSADYQKVLASSSVTAILQNSSSSTTIEPADAKGHFEADIHQDGPDLVVKVTAAKAADIDTLLIFFDTDCDASTGFQPPADPHFGFEEMIQGESLSAHTGDSRAGWSWKTAGPVKKSVDGTTAEFRFNASLLNSKKIRAAVWQMSADWQIRTNRYPSNAAGTVDVELDASKLHAQMVRPPLPFAASRADRDLPVRERFSKIACYCCYYGAGETSNLSHYDAAILHTPAQTAGDIKKLNDLGVVTIGYISVGEDEQLQIGNGKGPDGKASWYFDKNSTGKPDKNGTWNSWYANAGDPLWRANRVAEAHRLCDSTADSLGFGGIFLDTVETCDAYTQSREGMIQLIRELRDALPDKVIVINRGFSLLKESDVSSRIDGLMFESFTDSYDFDSRSYIEFAPQDLDFTRQVMVNDVQPVIKKYPLRVLALDYCRADQTDRMQKSFDRADSFGMVPAVAPIFLDDVYDTTRITPKPDAKYLSKEATPQSLSFTLDNNRNGFPAGTRIEPSSCFLGYNIGTIVDGIKDRQSLIWSKAAWASVEEPGSSQQVELTFPGSITGGDLKITFAFDGGKWKTSRRLRVETQSSDDSEWLLVPVSISEQAATCVIKGPAHRLRIVQESGDGSADRPDLMWIAQVELAK